MFSFPSFPGIKMQEKLFDGNKIKSEKQLDYLPYKDWVLLLEQILEVVQLHGVVVVNLLRVEVLILEEEGHHELSIRSIRIYMFTYLVI